MKKDMQDQEVIRLLKRWKEGELSYPAGLQEKRRDAFLAFGASLLTIEAGLDLADKSIAQAGHAANLPMTLGMKLTLGFLSAVVVGISTYLGITVYENRDTLRDFLQGGMPTYTLTSLPIHPSGTSFLAPIAPTLGTPTPTATLPVTATPIIDESTNPQTTPTKPGLHLGQTKTPKPKPFK